MAKPSAFGKLKAVETPEPEPVEIRDAPAVVADTKKQANRVGKKTVIFYDEPKVVRELKHICADEDRTMQDLMHEAVDDLLVKFGRHAFGKR